jgi:uncharacterized protein (DUF3084 family)
MESVLTPGTYRLSELEELFGRTRKTVERYIERFELTKTEIDYAGRKVSAVILTQHNIDQIKPEIGESLEPTKTKHENTYEGKSSISTLLEQEKIAISDQLKASQEDVWRLSIENARLSVKVENHEQNLALKDEAIKAKDETIQSLKTSMVVLERANKQMEIEKHLLEDRQKNSVVYAPRNEAKPLGFLHRLKFVFGVG